MRTDVPAAVSPFDAAFDGPQSGSCQDPDRIQATQTGEKFAIYDTENESAWITAENPVEIR